MSLKIIYKVPNFIFVLKSNMYIVKIQINFNTRYNNSNQNELLSIKKIMVSAYQQKFKYIIIFYY